MTIIMRSMIITDGTDTMASMSTTADTMTNMNIMANMDTALPSKNCRIGWKPAI